MELALTDFRLAGFLLARGIKFIRTQETPSGDLAFVFDNTDNAATDCLNEYPNSPEQRYDSSCKTMHDFVKALRRSRK